MHVLYIPVGHVKYTHERETCEHAQRPPREACPTHWGKDWVIGGFPQGQTEGGDYEHTVVTGHKCLLT